MNILKMDREDSLGFFVEVIKDFVPFTELRNLRETALQTIRYLNGSKSVREQLKDGQDLENKWYESLKDGKPDYSVYNSNYYLAELFACWIVYSKGYISNLDKLKLFPKKPLTIFDLGCGIGFTTLALKQLFPNARVIGTNLGGTVQYAICNKLAKQYGFEVTSTIEKVEEGVDIVFASEYFEHIHAPIDHLFDVITTLLPDRVYVANSFNNRAIGHFDTYLVADESIENKKLGRIFGSEMRLHGYEKLNTSLWNNRPSCWKYDPLWK